MKRYLALAIVAALCSMYGVAQAAETAPHHHHHHHHHHGHGGHPHGHGGHH